MNKEIKYQDLVKVQALVREMVWQGEDEVYHSLKDYLRRADEYRKSDNLSEIEKQTLIAIGNAVEDHKTVLVRVYGDWYQARVVLLSEKEVILDRRLPQVNEEMSGDRVFIWEIQTAVIA